MCSRRGGGIVSRRVYLQRALCAVRTMAYCFWKTFLTSVSKFRDLSHIPSAGWQNFPFVCNNFLSTVPCFMHVTLAPQGLVRQAGQAIAQGSQMLPAW